MSEILVESFSNEKFLYWNVMSKFEVMSTNSFDKFQYTLLFQYEVGIVILGAFWGQFRIQ